MSRGNAQGRPGIRYKGRDEDDSPTAGKLCREPLGFAKGGALGTRWIGTRKGGGEGGGETTL